MTLQCSPIVLSLNHVDEGEETVKNFNKQVCLDSVAFPTDINIRPEYHHEVPTRKCRSYTTFLHERVHFYIPINILGTAMQNMVERQCVGKTAEK